MAILKNISEAGAEFKLLFERDDYITDPLKTKSHLIGALCCFAQNFPYACRALKRYSGQHNSKMLRHFVIGISPCDEDKLFGKELLNVAREVAEFFKDCYVKYAIHTNTPHTHFHILVCNTKISDGKQISMSKGDLQRFKEHCSSVFRRFGLSPIEKLDKSDETLEINEDLFPKALTKEEQVKILFGDESKPTSQKPYYRNYAPAPSYVNNTINVMIPPGTQGTFFQGRNGTPCISFKPYMSYYANAPVSNFRQNSSYYGNTDVCTQQFPEPQISCEWVDDEPDWLKEENINSDSTVISDDHTDSFVAETEHESEYEAEVDVEYEAEPKTQQLIEPFVILVDPFILKE